MESVISSREVIERFLKRNGDSYSYNSGYGYSHGSGDGSGSGSGSGYGYSSGDGSGSGSGYGEGDSYNSGSVYSYSYGDGYGSGDLKIFCGAMVDYIDGVPTIIIQVRQNFARGLVVRDDFTTKECYIAKVGNSFAHGDTMDIAYHEAANKEMENMPIEERISKFMETFGSLDSKHTGKEFYDWHHILTGSCTMGRDTFCKAHSIQMDELYSVDYFLTITKDSFGSDVIRQIIEAYGELGR